VYTSKKEPPLLSGETPRNNERAMLTAIPVRPRDSDKGLSMSAASRINFGKMYTVEHNVKVFYFGDVRKNYIPYLIQQWQWVLGCDQKGNNATHRTATSSGGAVPKIDSDNKHPATVTGAVSSTEVTVIGYGTALYPWGTPPEKGQLTMQANDRITVTFLNESWGQGINARTLERGSFPRNYVSMDPLTGGAAS
jgi:hypothetical protein